MNQRKQELLKVIISQYIKNAQPVGSKLISSAGGFNLSPATIRNEMSELEKEGYIFHPHTSAGRVPTEKGYEFFVANFLSNIELGKKERKILKESVDFFDELEPKVIKSLAKGMAEFSNGAVFVAFSDSDFYYTGLSNLFSQPEFEKHQLVYDLSRIIDHLDQVISKIFSHTNKEIKVYIGKKNPFGQDCSSIITKYESKNNNGMLGILGPIRMDYQNNFSLIKYSQQIINNFQK